MINVNQAIGTLHNQLVVTTVAVIPLVHVATNVIHGLDNVTVRLELVVNIVMNAPKVSSVSPPMVVNVVPPAQEKVKFVILSMDVASAQLTVGVWAVPNVLQVLGVGNNGSVVVHAIVIISVRLDKSVNRPVDNAIVVKDIPDVNVMHVQWVTLAIQNVDAVIVILAVHLYVPTV